MAGISPFLGAALVGGGLFLVSRRSSARRAEESSTPIHPSFVLDVLVGPPVDPCLGDAYSRNAQSMLPEAYQGLSPAAQSLYGDRPVYFMKTAVVGGPAFIAIANLRVNEPFVEPVIKVSQELAPNCDWLAPTSQWSDAMVAFRDSIERMVQVIDIDIGDTSALKRPHPWEEYPLLRAGRTLSVKSGTLVAFELPEGDASRFAITAQGGTAADSLTQVGIVDDFKLPDGAGSYVSRPVVLVRPRVGGSPASFKINGANPSGGFTSGTLESYA